MVDIYNFEPHYQALKEKIDTWDTSDFNKDLIKRFLKSEVDRLSPGKKNTTIHALKGLFCGTHKPDGSKKRDKVIIKDYNDLTISDFKDIDSKLWSYNFKPDTQRFYNNILKRLYYFEFLESKDEEKQAIINRLQTKIRLHQLLKNKPFVREVRSDELVTIDETLAMLNRATRPIEKGLIAVAFEGGKRPNEYLTTKIKDVHKTKEGFEISITPSKASHSTEDKAKLFIYNLKTYFGEFWNNHPFKNNPEAYLFYREDNGHVAEFLGQGGATKLIRKLATKTGIKKRVSLYSFRRGGFTWKVNSGISLSIAGKDMGWRPGSDQSKCYLSIIEDDVKNERQRVAGITVEDKKMQRVKDKPCPWCFHINAPGNDVCSNCGKELDLMKILQKEKEQREVLKEQMLSLLSDKFDKLMRDPRSMKAAMIEEAQKKKK